MAKKFYETSDFKKLDKEWSKKLKESGFKDADTEYDREFGTVRKKHYDVDPVRIAYFKRCEEFLRSGKITDSLDLFIFERHCEGISNPEISRLKGIDQSTVFRRVTKLLKLAGIVPLSFNF